jgi:hypothetical protein
LKQYTSFRKNQGEEIKSKSVELVDFNAKLNVQKAKKKLLVENEKERVTLVKEKQVQEQLVNRLRKIKQNCI